MAQGAMVKLTAVQLWKYNGPDRDPFLLGNAADLSSFGFFQRGTVGEMLTFVGRTVARKTQVCACAPLGCAPGGMLQRRRSPGGISCMFWRGPCRNGALLSFVLACHASAARNGCPATSRTHLGRWASGRRCSRRSITATYTTRMAWWASPLWTPTTPCAPASAWSQRWAPTLPPTPAHLGLQGEHAMQALPPSASGGQSCAVPTQQGSEPRWPTSTTLLSCTAAAPARLRAGFGRLCAAQGRGMARRHR